MAFSDALWLSSSLSALFCQMLTLAACTSSGRWRLTFRELAIPSLQRLCGLCQLKPSQPPQAKSSSIYPEATDKWHHCVEERVKTQSCAIWKCSHYRTIHYFIAGRGEHPVVKPEGIITFTCLQLWVLRQMLLLGKKWSVSQVGAFIHPALLTVLFSSFKHIYEVEEERCTPLIQG